MIHYYMYDLESTGLKAGFHEINQISIIRISDNFQKTINIAVEHPERASQQVLDIQKITRADLKRGIKKQQAVEEINSFFNEDGAGPEARCIVGHNIAFDRRHSHALWEQEKVRFPADLWLCTKKLMSTYVKKYGQAQVMELQKTEKVKYGLDMCLIGLGLKPKFGAHSATIDTQNNLVLYNHLLSQNLNHVRVIENIPHKTKDIDIYYDFD